jgi:hypothetical protein
VRGKPRPYRAYYDFGVEQIIRKLFNNPTWCSLRGKDRDTASNEQYYGAADAQRINKQFKGMLFDKDNSAYELGFDFGQIFTFKNHSSGLLMMRYEIKHGNASSSHASMTSISSIA